jgi:hypothetical protein
MSSQKMMKATGVGTPDEVATVCWEKIAAITITIEKIKRLMEYRHLNLSIPDPRTD